MRLRAFKHNRDQSRALFLQIIAEMMSGNARLDQNSLQSGNEYSEAEAKAAFTRVARDHGWKV